MPEAKVSISCVGVNMKLEFEKVDDDLRGRDHGKIRTRVNVNVLGSDWGSIKKIPVYLEDLEATVKALRNCV